jgi:hypothetical protein
MINATRITDIIHFHSLTLMVYSHEGLQYIAAKPLVDLAGMDWRSAKKNIQEADNAILYGTTWLNLAENASQGGDITPKNAPQGGASTHQNAHQGDNDVTTPNSILCFRLDRARMFLARINTSRMKSHGNIEAAEALLKLQVEWAEVLHDYETKGHATKDKSEGQEKRLINLIRTLNQTKDAHIKHMLRSRIEALSAELGHPISLNKSQPDLFTQ